MLALIALPMHLLLAVADTQAGVLPSSLPSSRPPHASDAEPSPKRTAWQDQYKHVEQHRQQKVPRSSTHQQNGAAGMSESAPLDTLPLFIATDAEVIGLAPLALQARLHESLVAQGSVTPGHTDGWSVGLRGGLRGLLHGRRRPSKYTRCNRCTIISCGTNDNYVCTGHCKKRNRLFTCRTTGVFVTARTCPGSPHPSTLPADSLPRFDAAVVTATAPFVGCANITNRASGCPVPGTAVVTAASNGSVVVTASACVTHLYTPECGSPFFPFGYCVCTIEYAAGRTEGPCNISELQMNSHLGASGALGDSTTSNVSSADSQVNVSSQGNVTVTGFSDYTEEGSVPEYLYNASFNVSKTSTGDPVLVTLEVFNGIAIEAEGFTTAGTVEYDYGEDDYAVEYALSVAEDAAKPVSDDPTIKCQDAFQSRGDGVFDDVAADYYEVYYDEGYSGCFGRVEYRAPIFRAYYISRSADYEHYS